MVHSQHHEPVTYRIKGRDDRLRSLSFRLSILRVMHAIYSISNENMIEQNIEIQGILDLNCSWIQGSIN